MKYLFSVLFCFFLFSTVKAQVDFTGVKVMINPGHGGHDSDDRGQPNGFWESEGNLTKGLWLRDLLEARGCEVVMSRVLNRSEDDLPLSQIAEIANANNVDLFISIHSNAGTQTSNFPLMLYNGHTGSPSTEGSDVIAGLLYDYLISIESTHWTNYGRQVFGDLSFYKDFDYGLGVLYPLTVTGFLSEGSFHDHNPEVWRLMNLDYRKQEAYHMLYAMEEYFQLGTEDLGNISGWVRDSLLAKNNYTTAGSPDLFEPLNSGTVTILETEEVYAIDSMQNGFFMFDSLVPGTYHLCYEAPLYFADTVAVDVVAHKFTYANYWMRADKTMPSRILSTTLDDVAIVNCFDPTTITFSMNMDSTSTVDAFSIEPHIDGTFSWDENYLYLTFQPNSPYDVNSTYTITVDQSAEHLWGVDLGKSYEFEFMTASRNKYELLSVYPSSTDEVGPQPGFVLTFDAPVLSSSVIGNVYVQEVGSTDVLTTKSPNFYEEDGKGKYSFEINGELLFDSQYELFVLGMVKDETGIPLVNDTLLLFNVQEKPIDPIILDGFDASNVWDVDYSVSLGLNDTEKVSYYSRNAYDGKGNLRVYYSFSETDACMAIETISPLEVSSNQIIGMWMKGDRSGHTICIGDKNTRIYSEEVTIDFLGWKYIYFDFKEEITEINSIKFTQTSDQVAFEVYLDALGKAVNTSHPVIEETQFLVSPNPVKNRTIQISGLQEGTHSYSLTNMLGQTVQSGKITTYDTKHQLNINPQIDSSLLLLTIGGQTIKISIQ